MAGFSFARWRAGERTIDLAQVERNDRLDRAVAKMTEPAAFAELAALARTAPDRARSERGFKPLDPAGRPS